MKYQLEEIVREQNEYQALRDAIRACNYPALYAGLRKHRGLFFHEQAYALCSSAIESGCTLKAFRTILEQCIPLEEFVNYAVRSYVIPGGTGGLVQEAAAHSSTHILKFLLAEGCNPNARGGSGCSALEAALWNGAIGSVCVLQECDAVDATITDRILEVWGSLGMDPIRDCCFRIIAGRLLRDSTDALPKEIPLLPGLTVLHAARWENWPLVHRLCRETDVTEKQARRVLELYMESRGDFDVPECAELLETLFSVCPGLLRLEYPRYLLALCMLGGSDETAAQLRCWVEQLPGREIVLARRSIPEWDCPLGEWIERWEARMGSRLRPVLRRDKLLPAGETLELDWDQVIRRMLSRCGIRGSAPKGEVSRLAADVLQSASPELVGELCEQGVLFSQEDAEALERFCEGLQDGQAKRNTLLVYRKKSVSYEL